MEPGAAIGSMDADGLYRLCTQFLKARGLRILSVKREDDLWFETIDTLNGEKELLLVKRGALDPKDFEPIPRNVKMKVVALGDTKALGSMPLYQNVEVVAPSEFEALLKEMKLMAEEPSVSALPSLGEVEAALKAANDRFTLKDYEGAVALYSRVLEMKPGLASVWAGKGECFIALGRMEEALESYKRALQLNVANARNWLRMGFVLNALGRYAEEVECYDMVLKGNPSMVEAWNNKGIALYQLGRYDDALLCFDIALKKDQGDANAWSNKGLSLRKLGRSAEALASFDRALELRPDSGDFMLNKALLMFDAKDFRGALGVLDSAISLEQKADLLYYKGLAQTKLGDLKGALESLGKASETLPHAARALKRVEARLRARSGTGGEKPEPLGSGEGGQPGRADEYPCFGSHDAEDEGCGLCDVRDECREKGK